MKHLIKLQAMAFICAFIFASCKTDEPGTNTSQNILPKKIVRTYSDIPTLKKELTFNYNGNHLTEVSITPQDDVSKVKFTYTGDNITKIETFQSKDFTAYGTAEYEYTNDKVSKKTTSYAAIPDKVITTYTYNTTDSTVTSSTKYSTYTAVIKYYIKNKNLSKKETLGTNGTVSYTTTYDYDTKNHHLKNITGLFKIPDLENSVWDLGNINNNNVTKVTMTNSSISCTYEFNSDNYPTKAVEKQGQVTTTSEITY